jgi:hypothetical protein
MYEAADVLEGEIFVPAKCYAQAYCLLRLCTLQGLARISVTSHTWLLLQKHVVIHITFHHLLPQVLRKIHEVPQKLIVAQLVK